MADSIEGVTAYRFSISWARIIPLGGRTDPINQLGIQHYSQFLDALIENGITPFVTLFHWDLPQALYDRYSGMLTTSEFVLDFTYYAKVCFQHFGDRVNDWITFNEPLVIAQLVSSFTGSTFSSCEAYMKGLQAYGTGAFAPGHTSDRNISKTGDTAREPWRVLHSQILAHAYAARAYRSLAQGGRIGITFNADWAEPYSSSADDTAAAARKLDFFVAVGTDPIFGSGDYPESCKKQLGTRLPSFSEEEMALVKGSADFLGINQ
jgi:beta-glucosidase